MASRYMIPAVVLAVVAGGVGYWVAREDVARPAHAESAPAPAVAREASADNPKVASVGGDVILKSDVEQLYASIRQRAGDRLPPQDQIFWMLVDQIISSRLVIQQAHLQKLEAAPEVQNSIRMASEQILQEAYIESILKGLDSEAALKPRYDKLVAAMKDEVEVKASHILLDDEAKARDLIAQLGKGADFAALAKANSKDEGSKDKGGDLGFFVREAMVPEFANVAFALNKGQVSQEPVKSQFGWHIIKVEDRRPRTPPTYEQAKPQLLAEAQQEKVQKTVEDLRAKAGIEKFSGPGIPPQPSTPELEALERAAPAPASTPAP